MSKKLITAALSSLLLISGCSQATEANNRLQTDDESLKVVRELNVFNTNQGKVILRAKGKMCLTLDSNNQLVILSLSKSGEFERHFVGLNDHIAYSVTTSTDQSNDKFELIINPEQTNEPEVVHTNVLTRLRQLHEENGYG